MVHNGLDDGKSELNVEERRDNEPYFHRAHNQIVTYSDKRFLFRDVA